MSNYLKWEFAQLNLSVLKVTIPVAFDPFLIQYNFGLNPIAIQSLTICLLILQSLTNNGSGQQPYPVLLIHQEKNQNYHWTRTLGYSRLKLGQEHDWLPAEFGLKKRRSSRKLPEKTFGVGGLNL